MLEVSFEKVKCRFVIDKVVVAPSFEDDGAKTASTPKASPRAEADGRVLHFKFSEDISQDVAFDLGAPLCAQAVAAQINRAIECTARLSKQ